MSTNSWLVDRPFVALVRKNPERALNYLQRLGPSSLYHASRSLEYRKRDTWAENNWLQDYVKFLKGYAEGQDARETLDLYFNSPIKSQVDLSYLIRFLFQPERGYVDLRGKMEGYVFRGLLSKNEKAESDVSFRVSVSNACSSYLFPVHHSWVREHPEELNAMHREKRPVYFKMMSVNAKGMIFVYDLREKPL